MGTISGSMFNAASVGMSVYQSKQSAVLQRMEAELEADNLEAQARRKELEAREVVEFGKLDQADTVRRGRIDIAEQKSGYAASGVHVNAGSAVETAADKAAWTEYERQKIEYGANMESWGLRYDAAILRQKSGNSLSKGSTGYGNADLFLNAGKQINSILFSK